MGRQSFKAGYEFQKIDVEVQDVNPLYGLDTYTGQFSRPAGVAANNIYNLADFMLGPAIAVRAQHVLHRRDAAAAALHLSAGRHPRQRPADAERRAALRVRVADDGSEQRADQFRSGERGDGRRRRTDRLPIARWSIPTATTSVRGSASPTRRPTRPWCAAAGALSYVHINRIGSANLLGINGPQVVRAAVVQGDADGRDVPADRTGLSGGADRLVAVQSADRARQLHPEGLSVEPGAELVRVGPA